MDIQRLKVTISGTGFAGGYTARVYGMLPHKNGVVIDLAGITSGHLGNAERFAKRHKIGHAYDSHAAMLEAVQPHIDNIACANHVHGPYVQEAAAAGVRVIVLEKPPIIWPGFAEGRDTDWPTRMEETMSALGAVLDAVEHAGAKLLYAENFVYLDGVKALVELMQEARKQDQGRVLLQQGICAHQGSHAPAYDTPAKSGGGALFNKACHPLGPALYLKQVEGILHTGRPIRPAKVSAVTRQVLKHLPESAGAHFRVMQNVDDYGRISVVFEDGTVAELFGHDLSISGIRNAFSAITDFGQYDMRINPNDEHELFLPDGAAAGNILMREKLPTPAGSSFPRPHQFHAHGYVNEMSDAVDCALDPDRAPQSGPMLAWDMMAVLMAGYTSGANEAAFVDVTRYTTRTFPEHTWPDPSQAGAVLGRQ
ncbi:MAG: Gfo/Idh/MocA family protein [Candidatus Hydrogenedentota bacterium]